MWQGRKYVSNNFPEKTCSTALNADKFHVSEFWYEVDITVMRISSTAHSFLAMKISASLDDCFDKKNMAVEVNFSFNEVATWRICVS